MKYAAITILLIASLSACGDTGQSGDGSQPGLAAAVGTPAFDEALASLPTGLWSVRLVGGRAEAVISNGSANIGFACTDGRLGIRYRPARSPEGGTLTLTARRAGQSAAVEVPFRPDGVGDLVWQGSAEGPAAPFLTILARDGALAATGSPALAAAFPGTGAGEALGTTLAPGGCLRLTG
ncbi:MAG: hypothetical protein AAF675_12850 [Pseudomonadota bacterium]